MILLRPDCLVFKTSDGESVPCSAHQVTVELMGDSAEWLDKETVQHAAEAVLHYFKSEKGQGIVSVAEFSEALERVLRGFGLEVHSASVSGDVETGGTPQPAQVIEADLSQFASQPGEGFELFFFPRLRDEVRQRLAAAPTLLHFSGLRSCVKQLTGAKRWTSHCQSLNDQIVDYLRTCLTSQTIASGSAMVIS
jgi:hypothetical protein